MTLKAAWITPLGPRGPYTLTLESAEIGPGHQLNIHEHTFPITPIDSPKRHTIALSSLNDGDLDLLRRLLDCSAGTVGGYEQAKVQLDEPDDFPLAEIP